MATSLCPLESLNDVHSIDKIRCDDNPCGSAILCGTYEITYVGATTLCQHSLSQGRYYVVH